MGNIILVVLLKLRIVGISCFSADYLWLSSRNVGIVYESSLDEIFGSFPIFLCLFSIDCGQSICHASVN